MSSSTFAGPDTQACIDANNNKFSKDLNFGEFMILESTDGNSFDIFSDTGHTNAILLPLNNEGVTRQFIFARSVATESCKIPFVIRDGIEVPKPECLTSGTDTDGLLFEFSRGKGYRMLTNQSDVKKEATAIKGDVVEGTFISVDRYQRLKKKLTQRIAGMISEEEKKLRSQRSRVGRQKSRQEVLQNISDKLGNSHRDCGEFMDDAVNLVFSQGEGKSTGPREKDSLSRESKQKNNDHDQPSRRDADMSIDREM